MKQRTEWINIADLATEEGIQELLQSPRLEPYLDYFRAEPNPDGLGEARKRIYELQLHERYLWRVVSAFKWALGDLDTATAGIDLENMPEEHRRLIMEGLTLRPMQFALLLRKIYGSEGMKAILENAIQAALPAESA